MLSERRETSNAVSLRLYGIVLLAAVCLMGLGTWTTYHGVWRQDQYQLINLGQVVYDGGRLYVDCWENKPPGVAWIVASVLWVTGGSEMAPWIFPGVLGFAGIAVLYWSLRRVFGLAASVAVSLYACLMFSTRAYDAPSNHPDYYSAMFSLMGTSLFLVALKQPGGTIRLSALAGLMWGLSAVSRQTGVTSPVVWIVTALFLSLRRPSLRTHYWKLAAFSSLTFTAVVASAIVLLWCRGNAVEAYHAVFRFNESLLTMEHWANAAQSLYKLIQVHGPLGLPLAFALFSVFSVRHAPRAMGLASPCTLALAIWFIVENWFALIGPSQIDRYWLATWVPMLFLAADGFCVIVERVREEPRNRYRAIVAVGGVLAIVLTYPLVDRYKNGRYYDGFICSVTQYMTRADLLMERGTLRALGRQIQRLVPEHEKIYVLNYDPGIYVYSKRACAARFTYPRGARQREEIVSELEKRSTSLILVPVDFDPARQWSFSKQQVRRLYQAMSRYEDIGAYLAYRFLVRPRIGESK